MWGASGASAAELPAVVHKPVVDVRAQPAFDAPKIATLQRDTAVTVSAQQGLWYALRMPADATGYVRVNDVRLAYAGVEDGAANVRVLMGGKAGQGRVTETAGVRGIEESDLKAAAFDRTQLDGMVAQRVDGSAASAYAGERGWQATSVAYAGEAKRGKSGGKAPAEATSSMAASAKAVGGLFGSLGGEVGSMLGSAAKAMPKSEDELAAEELALGPEITGRILGARPLWGDADAQRRVNVVGRWVAAQTSRPDLPWTFGVIDTPEVNAFAAPGGFILITRGLYELLSSDSELAAALGHEITHCVQRDHYKVIRKQEMAAAGKERALRDVKAGTDSVAGSYARRYVEEHGASHHADRARPGRRVRRGRGRGDLPGPRRDESAGALLPVAEARRARQRVGDARPAVQDASAAGCADRSHRRAWLRRAGAVHDAGVTARESSHR